MSMKLHYQPDDGFVGDVVPVNSEGDVCHLLYLKAPLPPLRDVAWHTSYAHIGSRNLVHWEQLAEVISPGEPGSVDADGCWAGSVFQHGGTYHLFYCSPPRPVCTVCLATSPDLLTWTKDPANLIMSADVTLGYEPGDWRDPFVFRHPEDGRFWMLMTARLAHGPSYWRGCTGLAVSDDLVTWEVRPPIWTGGAYHTQECQDLFFLGGHWYLVYSEYILARTTRYRFAQSLDGVWHTPAPDQLDGGWFYAAKTVEWNGRRLLFAWVPTRKGETDDGEWEWGGALGLPRELMALPDGRLACRCPVEVLNLFHPEETDLSTRVEALSGAWSAADGWAHAATDSFALARLPAPETAPCLLEVTMRPGDAREVGVAFRLSNDADKGYRAGIDTWGRRLVIRRIGWPRARREKLDDVLAECPFDWQPGNAITLRVVFDGEIVELWVNDTVSLAGRVYDYKEGALGLYADGGGCRFARCVVRSPISA